MKEEGEEAKGWASRGTRREDESGKREVEERDVNLLYDLFLPPDSSGCFRRRILSGPNTPLTLILLASRPVVWPAASSSLTPSPPSSPLPSSHTTNPSLSSPLLSSPLLPSDLLSSDSSLSSLPLFSTAPIPPSRPFRSSALFPRLPPSGPSLSPS